MKGVFKGHYYKHQCGDVVVCFIVGVADSGAFVQVITADASYHFVFHADEYVERDGVVVLPGCRFGRSGLVAHLVKDGVVIDAEIGYGALTPLKYDIMGPLKYLPLQCSHSIASLHHTVSGWVEIGGKQFDLTGGVGYIEGDCGSSFPTRYTWVQGNDFKAKGCVFASVADVPLGPVKLRGCIAVVLWRGRQYRLATYLGARVALQLPDRLILHQGKSVLELRVDSRQGQRLLAPVDGRMTRSVYESASCRVRALFYVGDKLVLDEVCEHAGVECAE